MPTREVEVKERAQTFQLKPRRLALRTRKQPEGESREAEHEEKDEEAKESQRENSPDGEQHGEITGCPSTGGDSTPQPEDTVDQKLPEKAEYRVAEAFRRKNGREGENMKNNEDQEIVEDARKE